MKKLNFNDKSKVNINRIKRYYRRKAPSAYSQEKQQYDELLADIRELSNNLNKISKGYGDKVLDKTRDKTYVLTNPDSFVAQDIKKEKAKLPKNRVKTAQYLRSVRHDLSGITRKPYYNPENVKNYVTTIAAKAAGIKTKVANRTGQIKPDFSGATPEQKKAYEKARRFVKSGSADLILKAMGAYERTYGAKGKVANSSEVMANIVSVVQDLQEPQVSDIDKLIDEITGKVYANIN